MAQRHEIRLRVSSSFGQAVHEEPGAEHRERDEREPDEPGVREMNLVGRNRDGCCWHSDDDRERHDQLSQCDAEVATRSIETEGEALRPLWVEEEMLAIDDEKFPPPNPAVAAQIKRTHSWVLCP